MRRLATKRLADEKACLSGGSPCSGSLWEGSPMGGLADGMARRWEGSPMRRPAKEKARQSEPSYVNAEHELPHVGTGSPFSRLAMGIKRKRSRAL